MIKKNIFDYSPSNLQQLLAEWKEPAFRANQIFAAAWSLTGHDFTRATSLPLLLRAKLNDNFRLPAPLLPAKEYFSEDGTYKAIFTLADKAIIESVAIPQADRLTFCLSTQVGCALGCSFCATGKMGFKRNLSVGEIIGQIQSLTGRWQRQPTNLVFMGMGEPLQNLEALRAALEIITLPKTLNWSPNKSMVSTSGWLPGIKAITKNPLPAKLAFSLNAADDRLRSRLMPVNRRFPLEEVLPALRQYARTTKQQLSIEYILISGINDQLEHARALARLLQNYPVKINLLTYNPVPGLNFQPPSEAALSAFLHELRQSRLVITLRNSRGAAIGAACGQLAGQGLKAAA